MPTLKKNLCQTGAAADVPLDASLPEDWLADYTAVSIANDRNEHFITSRWSFFQKGMFPIAILHRLSLTASLPLKSYPSGPPKG